MNNQQVLKHVKEFVKSRYQMVLATNGEHPWIATLYYSVDDKLNFYFLSDPKTLHCRHIAKNPKVAFSIADSPQPPGSQKQGIQLYGLAHEVSGRQKIVHALSLWRKTLNVSDEAYTYHGMVKKLIEGRMYKVTPVKIKYFSEVLWEEGNEPTIQL